MAFISYNINILNFISYYCKFIAILEIVATYKEELSLFLLCLKWRQL